MRCKACTQPNLSKPSLIPETLSQHTLTLTQTQAELTQQITLRLIVLKWTVIGPFERVPATPHPPSHVTQAPPPIGCGCEGRGKGFFFAELIL